MSLPIPNLDDRRFDDLVAEAQARLRTHLPELTQVSPGDPVHSFIDLFAWMTESILYRANLIPERQRRVFLNLLQNPVRAARASSGVACIDAGSRSITLPALLTEGAELKAGKQSFTTIGEIQPTPLEMLVGIKQEIDDEMLTSLGISKQELHEQYGMKAGVTPSPFQPKWFVANESMNLVESIDKAYYLPLILPKQLKNDVTAVAESISGITLNIAIAPDDAMQGDEINELRPRQLVWELMSQGEEGEVIYLPLEVLADSSDGGRKTGVARIRLPRNTALFSDYALDDPMFAGTGNFPPELPNQLPSERVLMWLRLRSEEEPQLALGYLGVNGVDIVGQGLKRDFIIGVGTGNPDQVIDLPDTNIDPKSILLEVEEDGVWVGWRRIDFLHNMGATAHIFRLDAVLGRVYFGNGTDSGRRIPEGKRVRIASYLTGGGSAGNVVAGAIKEVSSHSRLKVRHEWPCSGGVDAETVEQAEQRIPQFLTHRNRAVTKADFKILTESNPVNKVSRAEVVEGFLPGASIQAARENVPGVVSVFVLPPGEPALRHTPKPTQGLLKDVFSYLINRVLIGTELYVLSPEFVPIAVSVKIDVRDPQTEQQTLRQVHDALVAYIWPVAPGGSQNTGWPMGGKVKSAELMTEISRVDGVRAVNALSLFRRKNNKWRRLSAAEFVELTAYQLPELLGVHVATGSGTPDFPRGLTSTGDTTLVPTPVIPDVC